MHILLPRIKDYLLLKKCFNVNIYGYLYYFFILNCLFFLEGKGGRKKEKYQCVAAFRIPSTGDLAGNPGMCPTWE